MDVTDTRKVDIHISSNHPTAQIYDTNKRTYTPNWLTNNLELIPTVCADSLNVTDKLDNFRWVKIYGAETSERFIFSSDTSTDVKLVISENELNQNIGIIRYKFYATYNNTSYSNEIVFSFITTGKDGTNGYTPQKGVDYFDGKNGEPGKSVSIKGVAYTNEPFVAGAQVTLYSVPELGEQNIITIGGDADTVDGYLVNGYLCVYTGEYFIWTGKIQGPQGQKGESTYLFTRYADDQNGSGFSDSPIGKKYIGFYRHSEKTLPSNVGTGYSDWAWVKYIGEDAKSIALNATTQVFRVDKNNVISPTTLVITAQAINTSITEWLYSTNGGQTFSTTLPTGVDRNGNQITITGSTITSNSITIRAKDNTYSDTLTIYKVYDGDKGVDAPIAFLTNESIGFAANAEGQIAETTVYCNVVAYQGTTKITPTIGEITEIPTGMTITSSTLNESNEIMLAIKIDNNSTLGYTSNISKTINIPVLTPVETNLKLSWSKINAGPKGEVGVGISSVTVTYGTSTSASTQPTSWQSSVPTVADGSYLWTRTITDYTDDAVPDTVTYTYTKQGVKGDTGSTGSSVTVSKIEYQSGTSATIAPTSTWSNSVVSVAEGNYLWTKTTFSDSKVAYGVAKQGAKGDKGDTGATGRGVKSIVEEYYQSTSTTSQSGGSWSTTVPTWVDGKYIWTRSVITYTDSTSSTTSPICITGQKGATGGTGASGVGINSVDVWYYQSSSATSLSGGSWATTAPAWVDGKYIWTKTITTYTNNTTDETNAVCITGQKGSTGVGVKSVTEYYLATASSSGVTTSTSGWTTVIQTITVDKKYLWNYEVITYTNDTTSSTSPIIIGVFGNTGATGATGKGIKSVTEYYLATASSSGVTTSTAGWTTTIQTLTATNKYLWNYELITYTDNNTATINPVIIGVYGDKGDKGNQGDKGADAYTVMLTNESHIFAGNVSSAIAASTTTQVLSYKGSTAQSVTIVSVNGKTASTSSTATGITGLSFTCSVLSGTSPTITFTCTTSFVSPSGTIPIVLTVDGVTITKMFTYSIAFKGATGAQGSTGTAASLVDITPSALYFKSTTGKDGTFTPDYIYLYPRFQTVTFSKWEYSTNGGTSWVAASGANGLTISTYNSVANTLRIARSSTLYTDTITSISFRCVSSNASVYDTVSIAKIYDVVDLRFEGRNLVLNSNQNVTSDTYKTFGYDMSEDWIGGETYTISIKGSINEGQTFGVWANGSATRVATLTYDASKDIYTSTFVASTSIVSQIPKTLHVYNTPSDTATESSIEWIKLEKGSRFTNWLPAPEDLKSITFQLYAPKGYLITKDVPEVILETFAYDGSQPITDATFKWYNLVNDVWTVITEATGTSLALNKDSVLKSNVYKCEMTYKEKVYEATATVEDKTDIYESIMCISSNARGNDCYWVLYTLVYTDAEEVDPLLGPISINAPSSPVSGDYWYAVDATNAAVQLKKYNGTSWANSTDTQSLSYYWDIVNDGSIKVPFGDSAKVQVVSCHDFTATATLVCEVSNAEDGLLTQSSLSLTDASDPIVSTTEPVGVVDGQIWIKPNDNGTYFMFIWDATKNMWIANDMDTRTKVYSSRPSSYSVGDLWITASDTDHGSYLGGTLLQADTTSTIYNASHWSPTLKYDQDLDKIKETLNDLSQYVNITSEGLKIGAQNASGELSPFTSLFTSTELSFYQNSDKLLTLANNQLTAPRIVVEDDLEVRKTINLGNLKLTIEDNGSFSFAVTK